MKMHWSVLILHLLLCLLTTLPSIYCQSVSANSKVRIIPPDAGCSKDTIRLPKYLEQKYYGTSTDLRVTCSQNASCVTNDEAQVLYQASESIITGQNGCVLPQSNTQTTTSSHFNSSAKHPLCFIDISTPLSSAEAANALTILMKFRPDNEFTKGTLLDSSELRLDVEKGKLLYKHPFHAQLKGEVPLKTGWNQIAIQIDHRLESKIYYSVFREGELQKIVAANTLTEIQPKTTPETDQTFRIGLPKSVGPEYGTCLVLENSICRNSNASSFYTLPNRYTSNVEENEQMFQRSLDESLKMCPNSNREKLEYYLCSLHFPRCNGDVTLIEPCPDFCEAIVDECLEVGTNVHFSCRSLRESNASSCISNGEAAGTNLFMGEVSTIEIYEGILSDQEIYQRHRGNLPEVSRPECLCPQQAPHLAGSQCYDNEIRFIPRIPTSLRVSKTNEPPTNVGTRTNADPQPNAGPQANSGPQPIAGPPANAGPPTNADMELSSSKQHQSENLSGEFLTEYINDNNRSPFSNDPEEGRFATWLSTPGIQKFTVEIQLEKTILVDSVDIYLLKPMPSKSLTIEIKQDEEWNVIHHFANRCEDLGFSAFVIAERPGVVSCTPHNIAGVENAGFTSDYVLSWRLSNSSFGFGDYLRLEDERISEFYQGDAVRVTFDGPPLGNFTHDENYHAVTEIDIKRRTFPMMACNCYQDGVKDDQGQDCYNGTQCPCKAEMDTKLSGKQCLPYIVKLYPTHGLQSGGTLIVVMGGGLGNGSRTVTVGSQNCAVNTTLSNSTLIVCMTQRLHDESLLEKPLIITLRTRTGFTVHHQHPFIYKADPVIRDIYPRMSIIRGGVLQTVIGENLDSVAFPKLIVYMKDANSAEVLHLGPHACFVRNSTVMECLTPVIPDIVSRAVIQRRSIRKTRNHIGNKGIKDEGETDTRYKRNTVKTWLNNRVLDWHMGLLLDGVTTYVDLRKSLPDKAQLLIFPSPKIHEFDPEVQAYKLHKGQKTIAIKGEKLLNGVQEDDYHITVGDGVCELDHLSQNQGHCVPPSLEVATAQGSEAIKGGYQVMIRIGEWYTITVGYVRYEMSAWDDASVRGGTIAVIVIILILIITAYPAHKVVRHLMHKLKQKEEAEQNNNVSIHMDENSELPPVPQAHGHSSLFADTTAEIPGLLNCIDPAKRAKIAPCLINGDRLARQHVIGEGYFGVVYAGELEDAGKIYKVAMKTIKRHRVEISDFLDEACVMIGCDHKNVIQLIGIVIQGFDVYIVMPFMDNGSLKSFVEDPHNNFMQVDLVHLCSQACEGMAYLESNQLVHRDLAARNCMVNHRRRVKVADFGLARPIYDKDYYRQQNLLQPLPTKWLAIECLLTDEKKFTFKTDVWSFGVLMWEVMTKGRTPYATIHRDYLHEFLRNGNRMRKPPECDDEVYNIMLSCWKENSDDRPGFHNLSLIFKEILQDRFPEEEDISYSPASTIQRRNALSQDFAPHYLDLVATPCENDNMNLSETPVDSINSTTHPSPPDTQDSVDTVRHPIPPENFENHVTHPNPLQDAENPVNLPNPPAESENHRTRSI